ncbi:hypothetical protein [Corynebacterium gerontici]|uniref:TadE-like protein n=1 Tax=Corynebacterium gerontici TaxID=2079234 RepID=A0A3G6J2Y9_9CORY|nr:hypothetical protein [Corynebacterium gerontici]AZA12276.1 hypothetical protein CGERO_09950 [Corynebacterium gerontici]
MKRSIHSRLVDQRGSVSIEAAIASTALLLLCALMVAALATLAAYVQAVDIAGAAARAYAIGEAFEAPKGEVEISTSDGMIRSEARVPSPFGTMKASAQFPQEVVHEVQGD